MIIKRMTRQKILFWHCSYSLFIDILRFFSTCGINDFVLTDIARPDGYRIRRILSAVINFIRFREDQSPKFDHLANECEATADKVSEVQGK